MCLNFIDNLYIGGTVINTFHDLDIIIKRIKNYESVNNLYLICMCDGNNLFEIIRSSQISKDIFKRNNYTVVGVANGLDEAYQLVMDIILDYISNFPDCNFSILKQRIV